MGKRTPWLASVALIFAFWSLAEAQKLNETADTYPGDVAGMISRGTLYAHGPGHYGPWGRDYPYGRHYPYYYDPPYLRDAPSPYPEDVKAAGRLLIQVEPFDAHVFVDGYELKQREGRTFEIGLLVGIHRVEVRKDGFKPYSAEIEIQPAVRTLLTVTLDEEQEGT
jgi:hypothetical protein